jgi:hypothetical protein
MITKEKKEEFIDATLITAISIGLLTICALSLILAVACGTAAFA